MIAVSHYWPFFTTPEVRTFSYTDKTGKVAPFISKFSYGASTNCMLCQDFDNGVYTDTWYLQYDPVLGVKEVRDDYPQTNKLLASLFGPTKKQLLSSPILWGNEVEVGQVITCSPSYNTFGSTPPIIGTGFQAVLFEALLPSLTLASGKEYPNILQFMYAQTWSGVTTGARYWMAEGVGPIAISWLGYGPAGNVTVTEPRADAVITG